MLVVKARNDDDYDDDCIVSTLGNLSRARIREIFIETLKSLNKKSLIFFNVRKFRGISLLLTCQNFFKKAVISCRGPCLSSMS